MAQAEDLTKIVANHYNQLEEKGLENRKQSRIFYLRNFNNWVKSVLIGETLKKLRQEDRDKAVTVLDLCCGKGGDLLKWKKGRIDHLVCADIAATSVEQCESRYRESHHRGGRGRFQEKEFSLNSLLQTVQRQRLRESTDNSFGNEVYKVTFENEDKKNFPLFGAKYNFHLEGVVDCPEFLVYFPLLEKMAEEFGMQLVHKTKFDDLFKENSERGQDLVGLKDIDYGHAQQTLQLQSGNSSRDSKRGAKIVWKGSADAEEQARKARDSISRMCKWYHSSKSDDDEGSLLLSNGDNSVFIWPLGGQRL
ncbi:hypothetical protein C0Q70_19416 [Pomacea canaliculata]|uniref:mRNA (guanine-N(7))-methyltransferase n=1 Tax=Pomacea canaliculata TaxID=400727 RepID=A0A2T7NJA3_POMCA|nr:hypothetical protein C0Q70_19416 [Pomacea canaliculata]